METTTRQAADAQMRNEDTGEEILRMDDVNRRVRELLGLTQDQFTQTVMIAGAIFEDSHRVLRRAQEALPGFVSHQPLR